MLVCEDLGYRRSYVCNMLGCASVHIVKQQTATFQTYGPGSVHLYATHDILTCIVHTDVYNLDLRILNIYTCVCKLILH